MEKHRAAPVRVVKMFSPCKMSISYVTYDEISLMKLETEMSKTWSRNLAFDEESRTPSVGMHVLFQCEDFELCRRAYILSVYTNMGDQGQVYDIFMYDYGTTRMLNDSELDKIVPLKPEYITRMAPRCRILTIPGVIPSKKVEVPSENGKADFRAVPTTSWTKAASSFLAKWITEGTIGYIPFNQLNELTVYGELIKRDAKEPYSVELTQSYHAICKPDLFESQVMEIETVNATFSPPPRQLGSQSSHQVKLAPRDATVESLLDYTTGNNHSQVSETKTFNPSASRAATSSPPVQEGVKNSSQMRLGPPDATVESLLDWTTGINQNQVNETETFNAGAGATAPSSSPFQESSKSSRQNILAPPDATVESLLDWTTGNKKAQVNETETANAGSTLASSSIPLPKNQGSKNSRRMKLVRPDATVETLLDGTTDNNKSLSTEAETASDGSTAASSLPPRQQASQSPIQIRSAPAHATVESLLDGTTGNNERQVRSNLETIYPLSKRDQPNSITSSTSIKATPIITFIRGKELLMPLHPVEGVQEYDTKRHQFKKILLDQHGIPHLNSLQRCVWPHVRHGRNCTIVGGALSGCGKTLSYLVPMVASAMDNELDLKAGPKVEPELMVYRSKASGGQLVRKGPIGLIICATYSSANKIKEHLEGLLKGTTFVVYATIGTEEEKQLRYNLRKNPEFFIVKADVALRLWEECFYEYFRFERLRFLVFDDMHALCETRYTEVKELLQKTDHHIQRAKLDTNVQTIFCGQEWNDKIACATVKTSQDNVLFIGAPMEALKYSGIDVQVHFVHPDDKMQEFADLFDENMTGARTIVFCKDTKNVELVVSKLFRCKQIKAIKVTDSEKGTENITEFKNTWKEAEPLENVILVTMDRVCKELEISDALNVIHFDLPENKGNDTFGKRYMTMWSHFPDITLYETEGEDAFNAKTELSSHVFITAEDANMHKIVRKLQTMDISIPESLAKLAEQQMIAESLNIIKICPRLKAIGKCNSASCKARHIFTASDFEKEPVIPVTGRVEVRIMDVLDVNVYLVNVLNYYQVDPRTNARTNHISYSIKERFMKEQLNAYFSDPSKLKILSEPKIDIDCIIKLTPDEENGSFVRGRIVRILTDGKGPRKTNIRVLRIDSGLYAVRPADEVYTIPEEFKSQNGTCVKLILANLKPLANEPAFPGPDKNKTKNLIEGRIYTGKIVLSIGDTAWVLPLKEHKRNPDGTWSQLCNVRQDIIKGIKSAADNPEHLITLYKICEEVGFNCDIYDPPVVLDADFESTHFSSGNKIQWAFLPIYRENSDETTSRVWTASVTSSHIYVYRNDYTDLLDALEAELVDYVTTSIQEKYPNYAKIFLDYYEVGMAVAVRERVDGSWNRGIITNMYELNGEMKYEIFFVDHGDKVTDASTKEMHPITCKLVERLPFQIIALRLEHIIPAGANWEEIADLDITVRDSAWSSRTEVEDYLHGLLIPNCQSVELHVAALRNTKNLWESDVRVCRCYDAFVHLQNKELGKYLVEENLGQYRPGGEQEMADVEASILQKYNNDYDRNMAMAESNDNDFGDHDSDGDYDVYLGAGPKDTLMALGCPDEIIRAMDSATANQAQIGSTPVDIAADEAPNTSVQVEGSITNGNGVVVNGEAETQTTPNGNCSVIDEVEELKQWHPPAGIICPKIEWFQDDHVVTIRIFVPDSQEYSFTVFQNHRHVNFATKSKGKTVKKYGFQLDLYGRVELETDQIMTGQYLTVKVKKISPYTDWDRLTYDDNNYTWIKVPATHLFEDEFMDIDEDGEPKEPKHISEQVQYIGDKYLSFLLETRSQIPSGPAHIGTADPRPGGRSDDENSDSDPDEKYVDSDVDEENESENTFAPPNAPAPAIDSNKSPCLGVPM